MTNFQFYNNLLETFLVDNLHVVDELNCNIIVLQYTFTAALVIVDQPLIFYKIIGNWRAALQIEIMITGRHT